MFVVGSLEPRYTGCFDNKRGKLVPCVDNPLRKGALTNISVESLGLKFETMAPGFGGIGMRKKEIRLDAIEASYNFESLQHISSVESIRKWLEAKSTESFVVRKEAGKRAPFGEVAKSFFKKLK